MKATKTGAGLPDKLKQGPQHRLELTENVWGHGKSADLIKSLVLSISICLLVA